ncbi:hypothetical protein ScPMuIL_003381 [Solemya velum]
MTVEQSALPQRCSQKRSREETAQAYAQIKHITGVEDEHVISEAIDACKDKNGKYEISSVVDMLVTDGSVCKSPPRRQKSSPKLSVLSAGVIDLTSEQTDGDELQKAIAASLQDTQGILGGQVTREEQDISRVLEQSLAESKAGTKRKRGEIWFVDPLNPHERKRDGNWPVGLKNVGNTCWFSAVIQSLFHLCKFRHLVLNFQLPPEVQHGACTLTEWRNLRFMKELGHLFALMVGSRKKYVDPSKAVDILKEAFSSPPGVTDSQQDISEFQHKLLEWLEDAFKATEEEYVKEGQAHINPMVDLFYGQYRAEGFNEGKVFSNKETFGQFPLQVNGFKGIHESLEAATAQVEIETVSRDVTQKSGQEIWFTRLPPVLTFELSRFQFNQQLGRPEKIHNKISFPEVIYMDRYMDCNKEETRRRREESKKLNEQLLLLQAKLDKFNKYGSGSKRVPLQDVLLYALEFAQSRRETSLLPRSEPAGTSTAIPEASTSMPQDVEMESPRPHTSMVTDSPVKSPTNDVTMTSVTKSPPHQLKPLPTVNNPTPRHVSDEELGVLESCLCRWRTEVENDVKELQANIGVLEDTKNRMYSDEAMQKFPYHLHAVLVHEGQAASGHYWAYVYDMVHQKWLKFNDITTSEASWEELEKESVGGYHNASAYCLMYVDKAKLLKQEEFEGLMSQEVNFADVPDDLKEDVLEDNRKFAKEIEEWDKEQARKAAGDGELSIAMDQKPLTKFSYAATNAQLSCEDTMNAVSHAVELEIFKSKGPLAALIAAANSERKRIEQIVRTLRHKFPQDDQRLCHVMVYLLANNAPPHILDRVMYEQFAHIFRIGTGTGPGTECWHETYHSFRKVVYMFVRGLEFFLEEKFESALCYITRAYYENCLLDRGKHYKSLSKKLIAYFRRQSILHLNDIAAHKFENCQDIHDSTMLMNKYILHCIPSLFTSGYHDDESAAEEIREKWCAFLGQEIESYKIGKLQDFLAKLFDLPTDTKLLHTHDIPPITMDDMSNLYNRYLEDIALIDKAGYIEKALQSS